MGSSTSHEDLVVGSSAVRAKPISSGANYTDSAVLLQPGTLARHIGNRRHESKGHGVTEHAKSLKVKGCCVSCIPL